MGRKNKAYVKDLHQQAYDRLTGMQAFGTSKKRIGCEWDCNRQNFLVQDL